jgi:hypothetical protein
MERTEMYRLVQIENQKQLEKLINEYEVLKNIPNINILRILSNKFFVADLASSDEHEDHIGI